MRNDATELLLRGSASAPNAIRSSGRATSSAVNLRTWSATLDPINRATLVTHPLEFFIPRTALRVSQASSASNTSTLPPCSAAT